MDIRPLSPDYAVAPQICVADVARLGADGYTHVICNRPASESAPSQTPDVIEQAVVAAGMGFVDNPLVMGRLTHDHVAAQRNGSGGKTLAYCASGTRSAILWALMQAGHLPLEEIMAAITRAGYPLEQLRGQIAALAVRNTHQT